MLGQPHRPQPGQQPARQCGDGTRTNRRTPGLVSVFAGSQLDAGSFGEAKIDLSAVPGLFTPDTCTDFGNMFVKSRSSGSSIDAELKDFIAPAPIHVSNCASPDISTNLSESTGAIGDSVHDSASLSGATPDASGTVTYSVYTDSTCTQGQQDAGTVDVTDGQVPDSNPIEFDSAGTFFRLVQFAGEGPPPNAPEQPFQPLDH